MFLPQHILNLRNLRHKLPRKKLDSAVNPFGREVVLEVLYQIRLGPNAGVTDARG